MEVRALAATSVLDVNGTPSLLGERWRRHPAVIVWLRHYGCIFCREQAAEMRAVAGDIESLRAELVFVGNGSPAQARDFRDRFAPDSIVLTDPDLRTYRLIGARHGALKTLGPRVWRSGLRALSRGARQTRVQGHAFQQGGVLVLVPGDRVVYSYISGEAGDHPPVAAVVDALRAAVAAPAVRSA
jgi:hypothetical protein